MVILKQCRRKLEEQNPHRRLPTWTTFQVQLLQESLNYLYRAADLTPSLTSYNERRLPPAQCKLRARTLSEHHKQQKGFYNSDRLTLLEKQTNPNPTYLSALKILSRKLSQSLLPYSLDLPKPSNCRSNWRMSQEADSKGNGIGLEG